MGSRSAPVVGVGAVVLANTAVTRAPVVAVLLEELERVRAQRPSVGVVWRRRLGAPGKKRRRRAEVHHV